MDPKIASLRQEEPLRRIFPNSTLHVRYVSFNVNSIRTLFNHHPWNQLSGSLDSLLACMDADIVSLQELKVQINGLQQVGMLSSYRAFVLVPKSKKGYSGVGLYVRVPTPQDPPTVAQNLTVVKAEEGITGLLVDPLTKQCYMDSSNAIGGYLTTENFEDHALDSSKLLDLDSEGRCALVELANGVVVFSLYCPANSQQTAEGQDFRICFLKVLLQRALNLKNAGKKVVLMGDINVTPDLIDSAEAIALLTKTKRIVNNLSEGGEAFEKRNLDTCILFKSDGSHRHLLNLYLVPTMAGAPTRFLQFLYDTTREYKKRQTGLYTVWNTQTNSRQANFGSRIDLILCSCPQRMQNIARADILPFLYGSDHCPVFTDFDVSLEDPVELGSPIRLSFEARNHYKLLEHRDILSMFSSVTKRSASTNGSQVANGNISSKRLKPGPLKVAYSSRKTPTPSQQPINSFFVGVKPSVTRKPPEIIDLTSPTKSCQSDLNHWPNAKSAANLSSSSSQEPVTPVSGLVVNSILDIASLLYSKPPICLHNEPTVLKTSYKERTKGKKFWSCARKARGDPNLMGEHRCNFFAWATKKPEEKPRK